MKAVISWLLFNQGLTVVKTAVKPIASPRGDSRAKVGYDNIKDGGCDSLVVIIPGYPCCEAML